MRSISATSPRWQTSPNRQGGACAAGSTFVQNGKESVCGLPTTVRRRLWQVLRSGRRFRDASSCLAPGSVMQQSTSRDLRTVAGRGLHAGMPGARRSFGWSWCSASRGRTSRATGTRAPWIRSATRCWRSPVLFTQKRSLPHTVLEEHELIAAGFTARREPHRGTRAPGSGDLPVARPMTRGELVAVLARRPDRSEVAGSSPSAPGSTAVCRTRRLGACLTAPRGHCRPRLGRRLRRRDRRWTSTASTSRRSSRSRRSSARCASKGVLDGAPYRQLGEAPAGREFDSRSRKGLAGKRKRTRARVAPKRSNAP